MYALGIPNFSGNEEQGLLDRLGMRQFQKNKIELIATIACFLSILFACNQSPDILQVPDASEIKEVESENSTALTISTIMSLPVYLKLPGEDKENGKEEMEVEGLALVFNPTQISLSISGCASGYDASGLLYNGTGIDLYTSDRNCLIGIASFQHGGEQFDIAPGYNFDYNEGSMTLFESSGGTQFFVKVETQITPVLNPSSQAVFRIVQIDSPQQLVFASDKPIIRIVNSNLDITEGSTSSITFTLEKVTPSSGDYTIDISLGGTIDASDASPMNQQIVIPDANPSYDVVVSILDDTVPEVTKNLELSLSMTGGVYFYGDYRVLLNDDDASVPATGQVIWLRPADLSSPISTWTDQGGGASHPASQGTANLQPSLATGAINSIDAAYFDGIDDIMTFSDHAEINTGGPYDDKVIAVVFRSSNNINDRQVIYEQGGSTRGLNIYLENGNIYFNGWNKNNDDAGATTPWNPVFVSTPVMTNTNYVAVLRYSYTNNSMRGYLQGQLAGESLGIGRLFDHSDDAAIGGVTGSTYYHDGTTGAAYFKGHISELMKYNCALSDSALQGLMNQLTDTYIPNDQIISIGTALSVINEEGSEQTTLSISRQAIHPEELNLNFTLSGSAIEGSDFENLSSYSVTIPAFELSVDVPIQAIDDGDIELTETLTVTLQDPGIPGVSISVASVDVNIIDNDSYTPDNYSFWYRGDTGVVNGTGNAVNVWQDISINNIDASQSNASEQPDDTGLINGIPALNFDGTDRLNIANNNLINTASSYNAKTIAFAIRTSTDITSDQVVYEQGGGTRGINIHIRAGVLYFNIWNYANDDGGATTPYNSIYLSSPITADSDYVGTFVYDFDGGGNLHLQINELSPQTIGGVGRLFKHSGGIALGASNGTIFYDNASPSGSANFNGSIAEMIYYDRVVSPTDLNDLQNYLVQKYLP
ncbi:MAG: hypothetical protein AB8G05_27180 [Oligoflexales bacterium]